MRIHPVTVSPWQANCYLVSAGEEARECLIIDPGITGADQIGKALQAQGLVPVAVLATHGHIDHVGDAHLIAADWSIPCYLDVADQHLLTRPGEGLDPGAATLLRHLLGGETLPPVPDVRAWNGTQDIAELTVEPVPAPGHTRGSTLLKLTSPTASVVFSGDVLFAGTIGRTDFPGGSMTQMRESLRRIVEHFPGETVFLPGHGQPTTLAEELAHNPYLQPESL